MQNIAIANLITLEDWQSAIPVLKVLRSSLDQAAFLANRLRLISEGYHLIGLKLDGELVAIASYLITPHTIYFRELLIHDMATLPQHQSKGFGAKLLSELYKIAQENMCGRCFVHSRNERESAHKFYRSNGYKDYSTAFVKTVAALEPEEIR